MQNKAVFLDRDGTINFALIRNRLPFAPICCEEFSIIPGINEALEIFKTHGFIPIVITNQPDFARGNATLEQLDSLNEILRRDLKIDNIYTCFHDDSENCLCRKPKIGLLLTAAKDLNINLKESILVGDRWKDIQAGQTVDCECFFINNDYNERQPNRPFIEVKSLLEVAYIIRSRNDF